MRQHFRLQDNMIRPIRRLTAAADFRQPFASRQFSIG